MMRWRQGASRPFPSMDDSPATTQRREDPKMVLIMTVPAGRPGSKSRADCMASSGDPFNYLGMDAGIWTERADEPRRSLLFAATRMASIDWSCA